MEKEIKKLLDKGFKNPSAITSILFHKGFQGKFTDFRKKVIKEIQRYSS